MSSKFKAESYNRWLTRGLFADVIEDNMRLNDLDAEADKAIYWLNENRKNDKRPILHDEFIKLRDPTGVELANKWLGGWEHFKLLLEARWFKEAWDKWSEELYQVDRAERLQRIRDIAEGESTQAFAASKYLANREYESESPKRGRPSKEEISGNLKNEIRQLNQTEEDYQRMTGGLTLINGGKK